MRHFILTILLLSLPASVQAVDGDGLVKVKSPHGVEETGNNLENVIDSEVAEVFARINHAEGAERTGLQMEPTEQIIFGNPQIGTPLMKCKRTVAIDLPQKILIWQDDAGQTWFAYNDPDYVKDRHGVQDCGSSAWQQMVGALSRFATAAVAL